MRRALPRRSDSGNYFGVGLDPDSSTLRPSARLAHVRSAFFPAATKNVGMSPLHLGAVACVVRSPLTSTGLRGYPARWASGGGPPEGGSAGPAGIFLTASEIEEVPEYRYIFDLFQERTGDALDRELTPIPWARLIPAADDLQTSCLGKCSHAGNHRAFFAHRGSKQWSMFSFEQARRRTWTRLQYLSHSTLASRARFRWTISS